jgi:Ca2+/H+ antiporter, TMEM165/GDT1 family
MDWKIFIATFWAVFLAELADKTQIVGIGMTAKSGKPAIVWAGSVAAYAIVTIISVFLGAVTSKFLTPDMIRIAGGTIFVAMGLLMFFKVL